MSLGKNLLKVVQKLFLQIVKLSKIITKKLMNWLLRSFMVLVRRSRLSQAGFILPTVTMVILVVTLLTTAIVFRSFDRTKNARNYKVDQTVMAAAAPAIERAKAKLDALFQDPRLPRATPSDLALYNLLASEDKFKFTDETRLKLAYDLDGGGSIKDERDALGAGVPLDKIETISTAWRFPVDTDNNGKYDSFTLYSILFRSPSQAGNGFDRTRKPLDSRTPPMDDGTSSGACQSALATSANLVNTGGWFKSGGKLKKSIYVYTTTVPITKALDLSLGSDYENYKGQSGFSALEYQQDRARIPLSNNAVVFRDDLVFGAGQDFNLNGSIIANSNFFVTPTVLTGSSSSPVTTLLQVSSPKSCFYQPENGKITVGGNLVRAVPLDTTGLPYSYDAKNVPVHLYKNQQSPDTSNNVDGTNQSVTGEQPYNVLYNSQAYTARINHLVNTWVAAKPTPNPAAANSDDPKFVKDLVNDNAVPEAEKEEKRLDALATYFQDRTRRVPFDEVGYGTVEDLSGKAPLGTGDSLRPPKEWMFPVDPSDGQGSPDTYARITLNISAPNVQPPATEPQTLKQGNPSIGYVENYVGDRISVGNNLPSAWYKKATDYATDDGNAWANSQEPQQINNALWNKDNNNPKKTRGRFSGVQSLSDVGDKSRNGFWEINAATAPKNLLEGNGGLRVVTGAGVYERKNSFLPPPTYDDPTTPEREANTTYNDPTTATVTEQFPIVWPDTMPMSPPSLGSKVFNNAPAAGSSPDWVSLPNTLPPAATPSIDSSPQFSKGDLRMRVTVVYHYAQDKYDPDAKPTGDFYQRPIACISSYYDPTDQFSSKNLPGLYNEHPKGKSNNGIVYTPGTTVAGLGGVTDYNSTTGLFGTADDNKENYTSLLGKLYYQANLVFPNGRFVNEPLRTALHNIATGKTPSLSDQSAIDSTLCSLEILAGTLTPNSTYVDNGAIQEIAFLDGRQIKAIDKDDPNTYPVETFTAVQPYPPTSGEQRNAKLTGNYDLSLEERQPLEIRATQLDINKLRNKQINFASGITGPTPEYLLPNSGIIYASRDDALLDLSAPTPALSATIKTEQQQIAQRISESTVDFKLDPTRRPSAIMLVNGKFIARNDADNNGQNDTPQFREVEKGLILATNLPAYVWAGTDYVFNHHSHQEFQDTPNPLNPTNFYSRQNLDVNFACRPYDPRLRACQEGDTWRPATVIADSITLLSGDFRFGFRNEGDYDLRNNQGDLASINKRKQNGFFANNYATNGLSSNQTTTSGPFAATVSLTDSTYSTNSTPPANSGSSYFNNFTTPVQRRKDFSEYVMEICRKLPVSECGPDDWVVGVDSAPLGAGNISDAERNIKSKDILANTPFVDVATLVAGTTARPPIDPADQRYARRVAFNRDANNQLEMKVWPNGNNTPIPLGINSTGKVQQYPYGINNNPTPGDTAGTNVPRTDNNALRFRTTTNNTGNPTGDINTGTNPKTWLYYLPDQNQNERGDLLLPDVIRKIDITRSDNPLPPSSFFEAVEKLNGNPGADAPSDYLICTQDSKTSKFANLKLPATLNGGACPVSVDITNAITKLSSPSLKYTTGPTPVVAGNTLPASPREDNFYIYKVSNLSGSLTLKGNRDSIFVFQGVSTGVPTQPDINLNGLQLKLDGVDPNNVFWVSNNGVTITGGQTAGNFLGNGALNIDATSQILGGRFLGFSSATIQPGATINAIAPNQPLLVPVLQIHLPSGDTFSNSSDQRGDVKPTNWLQRAAQSTFNLVMAAGNTPPRPKEFDGGVANYPRFLENWNYRDGGVTASIAGSLMQLSRSAYATSPFSTVLAVSQTSDILGYPQQYQTGNGGGTAPSYTPPARNWGYDVGLLSQLPDLFANRFTTPSPGAPNEFFRQVNRDDDWVSTLLCAKVQDATKTYAETTLKAINSDQRPTSQFCNQHTDLPVQ